MREKSTLCRRRYRLLALLAVNAFISGLNPAHASDLLVLARQDAKVDSLSRMEVADLYLGRSLYKDSLTPLDLEDVELRGRFYREVTDMSLRSVRAYWAKRVFTGRGRPPAAVSVDAAKASLIEDPGVVTYLSSGQEPASSKVLYSTSVE